MSLRLKFVLALLLSSLASVALVGGVAYVQLTDKFDLLRRLQASMHFKSGVAEYLTHYGSWQAGEKVMPFRQYMDRQQREPRPEGANGRPPGGPPEGGSPRRGGEPPFRFILMDAQYRVLLGAGDFAHGSVATPDMQRDAIPVVVNGKVEAYVSPQGVLAPGKQDIEYLAAMREALLYGAAAATALTLGLGLLLGNGLSAALWQLTRAVKAMCAGALRQTVAVPGGGEIALLATAFNSMSEELAQSHEALQQSNQTILEQANQLKEMSIRDALTDLYNRRHFDEQAQQMFEQSVRHGHPMTVVMGDIDFFKRISDAVAGTVHAMLNKADTLLYRAKEMGRNQVCFG